MTIPTRLLLSLSTLAAATALPVYARADRRSEAALTVTSSAFQANGAIPSEYTCDGAEQTPPLAWSNVPPGTKSIAIHVEDVDAPSGAFTHWLVTNIPPTQTSLEPGAALPHGAMTAKNGKGATGYTGPCPPNGTHHYHFRVFALDKTLAAVNRPRRVHECDPRSRPCPGRPGRHVHEASRHAAVNRARARPVRG
jgi:Raf kinase inhibitor-like YbhB/YbcL family protein